MVQRTASDLFQHQGKKGNIVDLGRMKTSPIGGSSLSSYLTHLPEAFVTPHNHMLQM